MVDADERLESDADSAPRAEDEDTSLLDEHRGFVRSIDDASRVGHSLLGVWTLVAIVLVVILSGVPLLSVWTLVIIPLVGLVALILGRRVGLTSQDRRLRARIVRYCSDLGISEHELAEEARRTGTFEFFYKLITGGPARRPPESQ